MSSYKEFKEELEDAKNYYRYAMGDISILDIENLEEVADKMLETIRCQEEALKLYRQDLEAIKRLRHLSNELRNKRENNEY